MEAAINTNSEIHSWLKVVLKNEHLKELSFILLGTSEKGDGYIGDILFIDVTGIAKDGSTKEYNLVLKCSKQSEILRQVSPVKEAFLNEIFVYEKVFPTFTQFQVEKGIKNPFNSIPKCYGTFTSQNMEVIALENLKKSGYNLWNMKKPLTRKHINMVIREYGKFHAISVAMREQQPEKFDELSSRCCDIFKKFTEKDDVEKLFRTSIDEAYEALKNELDENILLRWEKLKKQVKEILATIENYEGLKVFTHGDCWNNNFMYLSESDDIYLPSKVAIVDWQISKITSPIFDLSYFLFACISKEDVEDLDIILQGYYQSFANYLKQLGSDPDILYPIKQFLDDWKNYSKFGILLASLIIKICSVNKDEVPDVVQTAEKGESFSNTFLFDIKDKTLLKNRMKYIVKYVVENNLI